jgi:hypothetical protein
MAICGTAWAVPVTHTPLSGPDPAPFTTPFGTVTPGNEAGTRYKDFGVVYDDATAVATFFDPPPAFGGINGGGIVDLLTPVTGRIVLLGTTTQGLTSSVLVTAGNAGAGDLLLEVFNINYFLLNSAQNVVGGFSSFGISRSMSDIAYFRVSTPTGDTFGVDEITIETPIGVPEPATTLMALGLAVSAILAWSRLRPV